jgi:GH15 family glucan-1,4-alpha-glucosidase
MTCWLEDYGMVGDGESAALVGRDGSIDWMCWPRFDSDACFAAMLGREKRGYWRIRPLADHAQTGWRYREDTLLLETDFSVGGGAMRVLDMMPMREGHPTLVRRVTGLKGEVAARMELRLRFGYGAVPPWSELQDRRCVGRVGPDLAVLYSDVPLELDVRDPVATFSVREGQTIDFVLRFGDSTKEPPKPIDVGSAIEATERYWRDWIGRFQKPNDWPEAVRRSLLTLKALINRPTGGMVAAPTCSLPEVPGGLEQLGLPLLLASRLHLLSHRASQRRLHRRGAGLARLAVARHRRQSRTHPDHVPRRWRARDFRAGSGLARRLRMVAAGQDRQCSCATTAVGRVW